MNLKPPTPSFSEVELVEQEKCRCYCHTPVPNGQFYGTACKHCQPEQPSPKELTDERGFTFEFYKGTRMYKDIKGLEAWKESEKPQPIEKLNLIYDNASTFSQYFEWQEDKINELVDAVNQLNNE